jgi:hypothetical protein
MKEETKQWTWNDGWILMSIYLVQSKERTTLANVISAADAINHAIPTANELSIAFTKLVNAEVLKIENNNYTLSNECFGEIEKAYKTKGGLFESANKGQKWLNSSSLEVIKSPKVAVTEEEVEHAYKQYTASLGKQG